MNDKSANDRSMEAARQRLRQNQEAQEKQRDRNREVVGDPADSKPTPTQEENDLARLGAHITEHEPDGSPEQDPFAATLEGTHAREGGHAQAQQRQAEARRPAPGTGYQTRAAQPQSPQPHRSSDT